MSARRAAGRARALAIVATVLTSHAVAANEQPADLRLPLVLHITRADGAPVIDRAEAARFVAEVNRLYRPAGICFALLEVRDLDRSADLATVRDRVALRAHLVPRAINVFILRSIRDPDPDASTFRAAARAGREPSGWLNGAHIAAPGRVPSTYLIVRAGAGPTTLAHELGHFLGEGHHPAAGNVMSYSLDREHFDEDQIRTFRRFAEGVQARAARGARVRCLSRGPIVAPTRRRAAPVEVAPTPITRPRAQRELPLTPR
jgi:hypothetical protein